MTSTRTTAVGLLVSLFLLGLPVHAEAPRGFSLQGVWPGMSVSELLGKLGEPAQKERTTLNFPASHLRVTPDFSTRTRVSDVTGETDLAFGDKILARIGQTPEEIHAVLGSPDEALESTLSDLETKARVETYSRFHLTVYYRYSPQHHNFAVVMFSLTSPEMDDYFNEDPTER